MEKKKTPGLTVTEEPGGMIRKRLLDIDGTLLLDETVLPHDDLIRFTDRQLKEYMRQLNEIEMHSLFKESLDVSELDYRDAVAKCYAVAESFRESFPEAYFFTRSALDRASENRDDGSALFLLQNGMRMMDAARTLYLTRVRMRNVMEVCFGNMEGMTQRERWEHTIGIYPQLKNYGFSIDGNENQGVREHEVKSLMELYIFELCAVLRSGKRIARCQYCWRYFVPKTNKKTNYCDRKWSDKSTCKKRGPNLKRKDGPAEDKYLLAFKRLRARFYEREYRCYATVPGKTVPGGYEDWIEEACEARDEYLEGRITGEELLRRINPEEEPLDSELEPEPFSLQKRLSLTPWDKLVARDISFDPRHHFETMQFIDLGEENPQWRTITAKARELDAKQGKVSLREKYKK